MGIKDKLMQGMLRVCGFGNCETVAGSCYDHVEGQLSLRGEKKYKKHMKICVQCVRFMTSYLAVRTFGKVYHPEKLTSDQKEKILDVLNAQS